MNFRQIADVVMSASSADETEVLGFEENESLTRFANNCIHQNVTEKNVQITVRSVIATKIAIAVNWRFALPTLRSCNLRIPNSKVYRDRR